MFTEFFSFVIRALKFVLVVLKTNCSECSLLGTIWGPDPVTQRRGYEKRKRRVIRRDLMRYEKLFEGKAGSDLNSEYYN